MTSRQARLTVTLVTIPLWVVKYFFGDLDLWLSGDLDIWFSNDLDLWLSGDLDL